MIKFAYTILYVADVAKSVAFYQASFGFSCRFITEEADYAEIETGSTTLALASNALGHSNLPAGYQQSTTDAKPFGIEIAFVTDNVQETLARAEKNGATLLTAPTVKPWGQTVAYIRDIDGFLIELCTAMG